MVSVVHSVAAQSDFDQFFATLSDGLPSDDVGRLRAAVEYAWEIYGEHLLGSGERIWSHALGMAVIIAGLKLDVESRIAALLFAIPSHQEHGIARIEEKFGKAAAHLVSGISRLNKLRPITKGFLAANVENGEANPAEVKAQVGHDYFVAFSCKGRGVCPSCTSPSAWMEKTGRRIGVLTA